MHLALPDGRRYLLDRPKLMGVVNVTPDSFSDGGRFLDPAAAVAHGWTLAQEGADVLDVGGQSTRPGAPPVPAAEQIRRVVPVLTQLSAQLQVHRSPVLLSVDTDEPDVAAAALDAGAMLINDIHAGRKSGMLDLAARRCVPIVLMHMQGTPATMQQAPYYADVVAEVRAFLWQRAAAAEAAGVSRERIILDPGIGFGKTLAHNLALLRSLGRLTDTGYPVLLGTSRKNFLAQLNPELSPEMPPDFSPDFPPDFSVQAIQPSSHQATREVPLPPIENQK